MDWQQLVRPEVARMQGYNPGPPLEELKARLGLERLDELGTNENAWGPSPRVQEVLEREMARLSRYPDASCLELRRALARRQGLEVEQVLVGNGADDLLALIGLAFLRPGEGAVMAGLTFPIYRKVVAMMGGRPVEVPLDADYRHDPEAMRAALEPGTRMVFVCNPNNPTATAVQGARLEALVRDMPPGCLAVLDLVYQDFARPELRLDGAALVREGLPVIVLGSFSKLYGLAGLRIGYALAPAPLVEALGKLRQPFSVNRLAQAAALAALEDEPYLESVLERTRRGKEQLAQGFARLGLAYTDSQTNFFMVDLGREADPVCKEILQRGVMIRSLAVWGAPTCARVTVGTEQENRHLLAALEDALS